MPGVPGAGGPVPKRTAQRRRTNKPDVPVVSAPGKRAVMPDPEPEWHPMARDWFVSLGESGQAVFYQPSDWQQARVWAEVLSRALHMGKISSQLMQTWASGATELMTTEGARRRMRVELEAVVESGEEAADVSWIDDARRRIHGTG